MDCRACGAELPHHTAFCLRCGARVELGSVLGVGTDLPRVSVPAPEPSAGGFGDADGSGHSRGSILAMVATFVVLTVIGTFALTRIAGSEAPASQAATPSATVQEDESSSPTESSSDSSSDPSPSTSPTPATATPTPTPSESGPSIPAAARRCSTSGSDAVATAYAATERTSCEFATAVRDAYREAGTPDDATSLRAFSPVTTKWYSLTCDGGAPVRCTSTTNAVVLLAP